MEFVTGNKIQKMISTGPGTRAQHQRLIQDRWRITLWAQLKDTICTSKLLNHRFSSTALLCSALSLMPLMERAAPSACTTTCSESTFIGWPSTSESGTTQEDSCCGIYLGIKAPFGYGNLSAFSAGSLFRYGQWLSQVIFKIASEHLRNMKDFYVFWNKSEVWSVSLTHIYHLIKGVPNSLGCLPPWLPPVTCDWNFYRWTHGIGHSCRFFQSKSLLCWNEKPVEKKKFGSISSLLPKDQTLKFVILNLSFDFLTFCR